MSTRETVADILDRKICEAVDAGRYPSVAKLLEAAKVSRGYLGEFRARAKKNPDASLSLEIAVRLADAIGCPVRDLCLDVPAEDLGPYPNRAHAISAARSLGYPEAAIQRVLAEDPGSDRSRLWWFHRIEAEATREVPSAGMAG